MCLLNPKEGAMKKITIILNGPEGNAYHLLLQARRLSEWLGLDGDEIQAEMMAADYPYLLEVFNRYFGQYVEFVDAPKRKARTAATAQANTEGN